MCLALSAPASSGWRTEPSLRNIAGPRIQSVTENALAIPGLCRRPQDYSYPAT